MQKILYAKVEESVVQRIGELASKLHTTKKAVIEAAIRSFGEEVKAEKNVEVFEQTLGVWKRDEHPDEIRASIRDEFKKSMERRWE